MKKILRKKRNLISKFDPAKKEIAEVEKGEIFFVETAHHLFLYKEKLCERDLLYDVPKKIINPLTGPIKVKNTNPGDVVVIKILDIICEKTGDAATMPGTGLLRSRLSSPHMMIVKNDGKRIDIGDDIFVPLRPIIGSIGSTPKNPIISLMPGPHGGNLDDPNISIGAKLYLPVYIEGTNLALGDVHAAQSDGEGVCPVDINAIVTLKVEDILKNQNIPEIRIETNDKWIIDKEGESVEEALEKACIAMTDFLSKRLNLTEERIGLLLSSIGGFHISQAGNYNYPVIARAEIPKWVDNKGRL